MHPENANALAYIALLGWFPLTAVLFAVLRPHVAASISFIGGAMFLPEVVDIDFPVVPPLDKTNIPAAAVLFAVFLVNKKLLHNTKPFRGVDALGVLLLIGNVGTMLTNRDTIPNLVDAGQAISVYDTFARSLRDMLAMYLPFYFGRVFFKGSEELLDFTKIMAVCGIIYALPALVEIVTSPLMHQWVYGFMQHDFFQTVRSDSSGGLVYRPMVFMTHGLNLARFIVGCLLAAATLYRAKRKVLGLPTIFSIAFLAATLFACRSSGALFLAAVSTPFVLFTSPKIQLRFAAFISVLVLVYPLLRLADIFPTDTVLSISTDLASAERARSLQDRYEQEDILLEKARERVVFGWGGYSRNRVFDPETGKDLSVTDGEWIIVFGTRGIVGFLVWFGLYLIPVFMARRRRAQLESRADQHLVAGLSMLLMVYAVDDLPNSAGCLPQFFFAGVLAGAVTGIANQRNKQAGSLMPLFNGQGGHFSMPSRVAISARESRDARGTL
jgi:hypothetical protein